MNSKSATFFTNFSQKCANSSINYEKRMFLGNSYVYYWSQNLQFHSRFLTKLHKFRQKFSKTHVFLHCRLCFHSAFFDLLQYKLKTEVDICNFLHKFAQIQAEILKNACFLQWKCALTKHFSLFCKSVECWSRHPQFLTSYKLAQLQQVCISSLLFFALKELLTG